MIKEKKKSTEVVSNIELDIINTVQSEVEKIVSEKISQLSNKYFRNITVKFTVDID